MAEKTPLDELLATESEEIVDSWARALQNLSNSPYAGRPLEELRATCRTCLSAYRAIIAQSDQAPLNRFITELIRFRAPLGFSIFDLQRALLLAKAVVRPRLLVRYSSRPDVKAFNVDWLRFEHSVDVLVLRFSQGYHAYLASDLERQLGEVRSLSSRLAEMVTHDELTGLYNFRFFQPRLCEEARRSARYRRPLSLFIADTDYFKQVNDKLGHQAGNATLQHVASLLQANVRNTDCVIRYGGDEFAVLLPETTLSGARIVAEKVRTAIEAAATPPLPAVTLSIGVSRRRAGDNDGSAMVFAADTALYQAKSAGRNCVVLG